MQSRHVIAERIDGSADLCILILQHIHSTIQIGDLAIVLSEVSISDSFILCNRFAEVLEGMPYEKFIH
ncbi:hypothetical protein D3C76_1084360 [compost metagenome]